MATRLAPYRCASCAHESPRWFGRCPSCGDWSTAEAAPAPAKTTRTGRGAPKVGNLAAPATPARRTSSGDPEVDRVLGGGFVAGEVVLLAGEPGVGKSTLVLQVLAGVAASGARVLLATGEESLTQVGLRAARLGIDGAAIPAVAEPSLDGILAACAAETPDLLVVDSIQTVEDPALQQPAGSIVQVRECAAALARHAKERQTVVVLVGHVTKEGTVAGPRTLEHLVDAVVSLDGDRSASLRLLRASKNRFGSCEETGVFVMERGGLEVVPDPSSLLLADRCAGVSGSIVFPGLEGSRPVLVELQALATASDLAQPRRAALGVDARRLSMLTGVLEKTGVKLAKRDLFTSAAGGLAVKEPGADLALCLAIESAVSDVPVDSRTVAVGEVGLGGEVRRVPGIERRLGEAARLGFGRAIVPANAAIDTAAIELVRVASLRDAFRRAVATARGRDGARPARPARTFTGVTRSRPAETAAVLPLVAATGRPTSAGSSRVRPPPDSPQAGDRGSCERRREDAVVAFKVGDKVVYPHHGAATIERLEDKELLGETREYFILKLAYGELTLMVPVDSTEEVGLRQVTPAKEVPKVLKVLKKNEPTTNTTNWSRRFKANVEKLRSGDIYQVADVVRSLHQRDKEKGLAAGEKRMLTKARQILVSELTFSKDCNEEDAEKMLDEVLG